MALPSRDTFVDRSARYGVALGATAAAVLLRFALDPWLGDALPLVTLYGAVAAAVWFGGWRSAAWAAVLGYLACHLWFIEPRGTIDFASTGDLIGFAAYLVTCAIIIALGENVRRGRAAAAVERERLRITLASIGDAVITTDVMERVTSMNAVAESLTGWPLAEAVGRPVGEVFRVVDEVTLQPIENPAARALREGVTVGLANHTLLVRRDGSTYPIDDSAAPIRDVQGVQLGCVVVFHDVGERREREQRHAEHFDAARLLASIVTSSHDAIVSKSLEGTIRTWNAGAERLFGYSPAEAIGQHISLIVPDDRLQEENEILARIRAGELVDHFDTVRRRKDGQLVNVSLTISPMRDETGRIVGASKIARDVTEQREVERRIAGLNAELQKADQRKNEFLATLAHEMRGPLAPVRNSLEILKHGGIDPRTTAQTLATLERQVGLMERLIEDLLDVERIARNRLALRIETVTLDSVLHQAVEACRPLAEAAKHEVTVNAPRETILIDGDFVRLVQVFTNLLNNAYKYTEPGGRIAVEVTRGEREVNVSVKDNGIGIPTDLLPRIFEIFAQAEARPERTQGGLGLGLNLVKQLVGLHGGRVEAFSSGPGTGSEFVVHLPTATATRSARAEPEPSSDAPERNGGKILIADDLRDGADSLALLLRLSGHEVHTVYDGVSAVEAAARLQPDLVLLDLGMPRLNGFDACRRIRELPGGRDMTVVALTSWAQDDDRRRSRDSGFDAHLVKPAESEEIERLLRERSKRR